MIQQFRDTKCLVCELKNTSPCPNKTEHDRYSECARRQTMGFLKLFRDTRHKIESYIVCYKCFCPQDICTKKFGDKVDCPNMFVMLDTIYLICILNKSLNRVEYNDLKFMFGIIRNFGHYQKTIQMVKTFHDIALQYKEEIKR